MQSEKRQKYFVNRQQQVTIRCNACGRGLTFATARFRGRRHALKVTCPCSRVIAIELEFRQDYRMQTRIPATYRALSTPRSRARHGIVANHSRNGLMLMIDEEVPVKANDRLVVCYRPQANLDQEIERIITVRHHQRGRSLGGAFIEAPPSSPAMASLSPGL